MTGAAWLRAGWSRLGARDRRALVLGALVITPLVVWTGVGKPYLAAIGDARSRLEAEGALLAREQGLLAVADELPDRVALARGLLARESASVLPAPNAVAAEGQLIELLRRAATRSRVLVREVRAAGVELGPASAGRGGGPPPGAEETAGLGLVRLGVRAESDLAGLAAFLNGIESDAIVIRVAELSLEPARADPREARSGAPAPSEMGALAMSFIVEAYWMVSDRSAAAAALDVAEIRLTGLPQ